MIFPLGGLRKLSLITMKLRLPNSLNASALTPFFRLRSQGVLVSLLKITRPLSNSTGLRMSQPLGPDARFVWIDCEVIEQRFLFLTEDDRPQPRQGQDH